MFFSSGVQDAADPISDPNDQSKVSFAFKLFLLFSRVLMLCGCSDKSIKPNSVAWGCLCEIDLCALQKHLRSISTWNVLGHMGPSSLSRVNTSMSLWCRKKHVLNFLYLLITLRARRKSTAIFLEPLLFGKCIHGAVRKILDHKFPSDGRSFPSESSFLCADTGCVKPWWRCVHMSTVGDL